MFYGCTQAHEEEYSSGSIKQLKQFSKRVQTSLLADAYVSISLRIRLDKPTDTSSLAYAVISLTQHSHIHNPAQPYSCLDAAVFVNKFFVIIYHPSRFASLVHFNRLIYRLFKQRDRYFKNGNIHHAIHHDLGLSLTIFSPHSIRYCISLLKHFRKVNVNYK